MPLSTYLKTPLTDLTGPLINCQFIGICSNLEMRAINCLEAYGEERAQIKCKELLEDFHECLTKSKQMLRVLELKVERERQVKSGERGYAEGPALDSYQGTTTL